MVRFTHILLSAFVLLTAACQPWQLTRHVLGYTAHGVRIKLSPTDAPLTDALYDPDERFLITISDDAVLKKVHMQDGRVQLIRHISEKSHLKAISRDGTLLAITTPNGGLQLWKTTTLQQLWTKHTGNGRCRIAEVIFDEKETRLTLIHDNGAFSTIELRTQRERQLVEPRGHRCGLASMALSTGGKFALFWNDRDNWYELWDVHKGRRLKRAALWKIDLPAIRRMRDLQAIMKASRRFHAYSHAHLATDGSYAFMVGTYSNDRTSFLNRYDLTNGSMRPATKDELLQLPFGFRLLTWNAGANPPLPDEQIAALGPILARAPKMSPSPRGRYILMASKNGDTALYDTRDYLKRWDNQGINFGSERAKVAIARNGSFFAVGSMDGTVKLWDTQSRKLLRILTPHAPYRCCKKRNGATTRHRGKISALALSRNGTSLAAVSGAGDVTLFEVPAGSQLKSFPATNARQVEFSPNDKRLLLSYSDTAYVYDIRSGTQWHWFQKGTSEPATYYTSTQYVTARRGAMYLHNRWGKNPGPLFERFRDYGSCDIPFICRFGSTGTPRTHRGHLNAIIASSHTETIVSVGPSRDKVIVWDAGTQKEKKIISEPFAVRMAAMTGDGQHALLVGHGISVWRLAGRPKRRWRCGPLSFPVSTAAIADNARTVVLGQPSGVSTVVDMASCALYHAIADKNGSSITWTPAGSVAASPSTATQFIYTYTQ